MAIESTLERPKRTPRTVVRTVRSVTSASATPSSFRATAKGNPRPEREGSQLFVHGVCLWATASLNSPGCYELAGLGRREHPAEQGRQEFGKPEPKLKRQAADVTGAEIGRQRHRHSDLFLSQQRIPPRVGM